MLVLHVVALWFILRGDLFYVLPCVILCFSVLLALRLPRLGKRELILVLFVCFNTKRIEKHKNKMTHGKTYNKSPRRINHKATESKTNTWTTALERSVE